MALSPYGCVVAQNAPIVIATNRFLELSSNFDREFNFNFRRQHIGPAPKPLGLRSIKKFNRLLEMELCKHQR